MNPVADLRIPLLYHFCRIQRPRLLLSFEQFAQHLRRMHERALHVQPDLSWELFILRWQALDGFLAAACMERQNAAWEMLFCARVGRADRLLMDALRTRAARLYPRQELQQESVVDEFWGQLLAPPREGSLSILARYDGLRPLIPWLLRVFQNRNISTLRSPSQHHASLSEDDQLASPVQPDERTSTVWHEMFRSAARGWLTTLNDQEILLLGLRWRYQLSQREAATLLKIHEGTLSRQIDKLRERCVSEIQEQLEAQGWSEDDLQSYILSEMGTILLEDHRLSLASLSRRMKQLGLHAVPKAVIT